VVNIGLYVGLTYLILNTNLSPTGIEQYYSGNENVNIPLQTEMKFAKSLNAMLISTHNHLLGVCAIIFILSLLYLQTGKVTIMKKIIAVEPPISLVITFGSLWLLRFLHSNFVYLVIVSGILMFLCLIWMSIVIIKTCLFERP
jgi:hypothetical protein